MSRLIRIIVLLLLPLAGFSQTTLEEFRSLAKENFPKMKQTELLGKITELKNQNVQSNYLPQIDLKGQATYQSEVIEIDLPLPNFSFDPVSKDQYKIYLDVKQTVWDGGLSKAQIALQNAEAETNIQKLQIELQQVVQMVDAYYFGVLMVDQNLAILNTKSEVLLNQISKMESAIQFGAARDKERLKLQLENLQLKQNLTGLSAKRKTYIDILSLLCGKTLTTEIVFTVPAEIAMETGQMRPELKYFNLQARQLDFGNNLLSATRNPKLFGFGQAGYGKPGFNMLSNQFSPYYIVGLGLNWRLSDWKNVKRNQTVNEQTKALIHTLQNDFLQNQERQKIEALGEINSLRQLIKTDQQIVDGREDISKASSAELENGTITSTDYLIDLNAFVIAKINMEIHKIQLKKAIVNYNSILGY